MDSASSLSHVLVAAAVVLFARRHLRRAGVRGAARGFRAREGAMAKVGGLLGASAVLAAGAPRRGCWVRGRGGGCMGGGRWLPPPAPPCRRRRRHPPTARAPRAPPHRGAPPPPHHLSGRSTPPNPAPTPTPPLHPGPCTALAAAVAATAARFRGEPAAAALLRDAVVAISSGAAPFVARYVLGSQLRP